MIWLVVFAAAIGSGWLFGHGDASSNLRAATEAATAALLLSMLGVTVGLYGRDRVRLGKAYSSPTLAWLSKRLLMASIAAAATFALSPVAWPSDCVTAFAAASALGGAVWVGNLPVRL